MASIKQEYAEEDGWSRWVPPIMQGYKLGCCDCGLVHDMEFRVIRVVSGDPDGEYEAEALDPNEYKVEFRVRRNNRSTAQVRRHDKRRRAESNNES